MNDPAKADAMMEFSGRSDPNAVADYIVELLEADLRPDLGKARVPILVLAGTESFTKGMPDSERRLLFQRILAKAPRASVVLIHGARHFVQINQPEAVGAAIETFLADLEMTLSEAK